MKTLLIPLILLAATTAVHADDKGPALRRIMQELSLQMQKGTDAISREDWPALAQIAPKIADHPAPPMAERMRVFSALGSDVPRFRELDQQTHHAAEDLGEAAKDGDAANAIASFAKVQSACMACHQGFRARVHAALDAP